MRADGAEDRLARLSTGRYFGELGPLFGLRRSATADCVGGTYLVTITRWRT